jgi:hypothetical protein
MHQRLVLTFIGAACLSLLACNKEEKKEASPEPAATTATPNTTPESPAGGANESDKAGAAQPTAEDKTDTTGEKNAAGTASPDIKAPTTKVANGEKEVKTDGKDLNLKNESGKGGVTTAPGGGVKVTGKSGKSIAVPGL